MCRKSSGTWSRRWLPLLLALFSLTLCLPGLSAQTQLSSAPLTPQQQSLIQDSLEQLLIIKQLSLLFGDEVTTWPLQIEALLATSAQQDQRLQQSDKQIASSEAHLKASEAARLQQSAELDKSQIAQTEESQTFASYKQASESAQVLLNSQLAQERAHRLFTDYATWTAVGAAGGAIAGAAAGKSAVSSVEGAGIGAASGFVVKLAGDLMHLW